ISGSSLVQVNIDLTLTTLKTGLAMAPMYWTEINDQVFFNNGVDSGIITKDGTVLPWSWPEPSMPQVTSTDGDMAQGIYRVACTFIFPDGRETGASDAAAVTLSHNQSLL